MFRGGIAENSFSGLIDAAALAPFLVNADSTSNIGFQPVSHVRVHPKQRYRSSSLLLQDGWEYICPSRFQAVG